MLKAGVNKDTGKWTLRLNICGKELESEEHESAAAAARDIGYKLSLWLWDTAGYLAFLYTNYKYEELNEEAAMDRMKYGCRKLRKQGITTTFYFVGSPEIVYNDEDNLREVVRLYDEGKTLSRINLTSQSDTERVVIDLWPKSVRFNETAPARIISLWDAGGEILHISGREFERVSDVIVSWTRDRVTDWLASIVLASKKED